MAGELSMFASQHGCTVSWRCKLCAHFTVSRMGAVNEYCCFREWMRSMVSILKFVSSASKNKYHGVQKECFGFENYVALLYEKNWLICNVLVQCTSTHTYIEREKYFEFIFDYISLLIMVFSLNSEKQKPQTVYWWSAQNPWSLRSGSKIKDGR